MTLWKPLMFWKLRRAGSSVAVILFATFAVVAALAQLASTPIKQGLWETTVTSTNVMSLPPDMEARIAAMPQAQQDMVRARMGGAPVTSTNKSCLAKQETMNSMLDEALQKPGVKCEFSNRQETANAVSFDTTCTLAQGIMKGHSEIHMVDSEHATGATHIEGDVSSPRGGTTTMKVDTKMTWKYLGADCGDVKPNAGSAN